MTNWLFGFHGERERLLGSTGLLLLRLGIGFNMLISHGWGKLMRLASGQMQFADPFALGPTVTLTLAVFAEVFCSACLILGLLTRLAVIPLAITMLTAIFIIHADDPWRRQEFAMLFLIPYLTLFFTGAGRFSLDYFLSRK